MHSREPDLIDARALVESSVRFGEGADAIPEFARPVIVSVVSEVLSIARKEEYAVLSSIADCCSRSVREPDAMNRIAEVCRLRLSQLSGSIDDEAASLPATFGRPPTPQYVDRRQGDQPSRA